MNYHSLRIEDKILFDRFLKNNRRYELSTYAFTNIFIWQGLFKIFWTIIEDNLCIFFKDILGVFLYLPPLGERQSKNLIEDCFNIMDGFNLNREVSRIENVEESRLDFYRVLGYECVYKGCDYIYSSDRLLGLRGNSLKHKRAAFNYFVKHYRFNYLPFSTR